MDTFGWRKGTAGDGSDALEPEGHGCQSRLGGAKGLLFTRVIRVVLYRPLDIFRSLVHR